MKTWAISAASAITAQGWGGTHSPWREWATTPAAEGSVVGPSSFRWKNLFDAPSRSFARADPLTKIASATVELLHPAFEEETPQARESIGVYLGTSSGSLEIDAQYWRDLKREGRASPMQFTYTLPSTPLGEIAIRHKLRGPNLCLLCPPDGGAQTLEEAGRAITLAEAETIICVYADAIGEAASKFTKTIGSGRTAGSAAYAVIAETPLAAERGGRSALAEAPSGGRTMVDLCEKLCAAPRSFD